MNKLIFKARKMWTRWHGYRIAASDLVAITLMVNRNETIEFYFGKKYTVKMLKQAMTPVIDMKPQDMDLLNNGELLRDNLKMRELATADTGSIKLTLASHSLHIDESFTWKGHRLYAFPYKAISRQSQENARWFFDQNERDKPRRLRRIREILDSMGADSGPPVIMTFNSGFSSMFLNWVASCDANEISVRDRAIIFAMDKECRDIAENHGFSVCYDEDSELLKTTGTAKWFGDTDFKRHMFFQNAVIQDMLELGCDFLFQDADIVWLKNPFEYFEEGSVYDMEFMFDGINSFHAPLHANTGFIYFRNRPATRDFWKIIYDNYDRIDKIGSQQSVLNKYLGLVNDRGLKINILQESLFANGHLFYSVPERTCRLPDNPMVIHCSWTSNVEQKIEKYKLNDLWFISTDQGIEG
jgi:hypothetical protein